MYLIGYRLEWEYFKKINDTYGHHIGDVSLKKFTDVCQNVLRNIDIFGRLGGEDISNGFWLRRAVKRVRGKKKKDGKKKRG